MDEKSLTVVQVVPWLESGGVEKGTLEIAEALVRYGHRSIVISAHGSMVKELERKGSQHINWDIGKKSLLTLRFVPKLRRMLYQRRVDILHVRSRLPAWIGYLAWRGMNSVCRPRFVTTVHGLYSVKHYSSIMTYGERVIAVSDTARNYITHNYPNVDPHRIQVIHRGVDQQRFFPTFQPDETWLRLWYEHYPQLRDKRVITLPGRLTRLKGHHSFIKLIGALNKRGLNIQGLIVGGEDPKHQDYFEELHLMIKDQGLERAITWTGHREDLREILSVSDVVLSLSTRPESFGRTVLESLSLGTPVVAYAHGGVAEILRRIYPEGCVPMDDFESLLNRVALFLERALPVPRSHPYTLDSMLNMTLKIYRELCEENRSIPASNKKKGF